MLHRDLRFHTSSIDDGEFASVAAWMIEGLIRTNMHQILTDGEMLPGCPRCGGVRYVKPQLCRDCDPVNHPCQDVYDVRTMMTKKHATCYDLSAERAARLRIHGEDAHVEVERSLDAYDRPVAGGFHAFVEYDEGRVIQDPAEELRLNPPGPGPCGCSDRWADIHAGGSAIARVGGGELIFSTRSVAVLARPGRVA